MDDGRTRVHGVGRFEREPPPRDGALDEARALVTGPEDHIAWDPGDGLRVLALSQDWIRVGRSLAADVRFDDATVSRRHALLVKGPDGVRVLDDRSLNGVFVNDERVSWRTLRDGDEVQIGRHRLRFLAGAAVEAGPPRPASVPA